MMENQPTMKLQIILALSLICALLFAYSNMKDLGSECPYFKKHGKYAGCPCTMTKEALEKCPHLKKLKEAHGDKPGCPYKEGFDGEKSKDCPYFKKHGNDQECPCKKMKKKGCPHCEKTGGHGCSKCQSKEGSAGCPYANKNSEGCPFAETLDKAKGCPFFEKHGKLCPCTMSKEDLDKCPHLKKLKEAHGDKPGCPYKEGIEGEESKECPYLKAHGNDKECPCKKMKENTGCQHMKKTTGKECPHMKKMRESDKNEL